MADINTPKWMLSLYLLRSSICDSIFNVNSLSTVKAPVMSLICFEFIMRSITDVPILVAAPTEDVAIPRDSKISEF